jgi:hypothetical protein
MRTTIDLPDDLFRRAKAEAAHRGIKMKDLFASVLEKELASQSTKPKKKGMGRPVPVVVEAQGWTFPFKTNAELFEAIEREEEN